VSRGLTDLPEPEPENNNGSDVENIIRDLILAQNRLHDRLVDLERKFDHLLDDSKKANAKATKPWARGL
jgi:hypothetical protein